jgi:hypothetical protein
MDGDCRRRNDHCGGGVAACNDRFASSATVA